MHSVYLIIIIKDIYIYIYSNLEEKYAQKMYTFILDIFVQITYTFKLHQIYHQIYTV